MKEIEAKDINGLISNKSLRQDNKKRLLEAELLHRSHQFRNFDRLKYRLTRDGEDHATAFKRLSTARNRLIKRVDILRGHPVSASNTGGGTFDSSPGGLVAPRLGGAGEGAFVFGTEGCVALPRASEGISVVPGASVTSGRIQTVARGPLGNVEFNGAPFVDIPDTNVDLENEHVWLHNWRYVVLFPCVRTASTLTYKFEVNLDAQLISEASGMIMSFVSIGEEPSASPTSNIEVDTPVGWLLIADLDERTSFYNGNYGFIQSSMTVERAFEVGANRTAAVAIIVGYVVRLSFGRLVLQFMRNSGIGFSFGRVCYRYVPVPVLSQG